MHCIVLLPGLFPSLPENGTRPSVARAPALEIMLARGDMTVKPARDRNTWLCQTFGVAKQNDWPIAPLLLRADGGDSAAYFWLCADPVHLRPDRSRLVLAASIADLSKEESAALVATLNQHFAPDGIVFDIAPSGHWYLRTNDAPRIVTTPLAQVINRDVDRYLPQGDDALTWHRVINEAQMILHEHPVNEMREARGRSTVNSVWLWGGGVMPSQIAVPYAAVWSDDPLAHALAATTHHSLPPNGTAWFAEHPSGDAQLLFFTVLERALEHGDLDTWIAELARLERDWMAPLLTALRARTVAGIRLVIPGAGKSTEIALAPFHWWRWWRRRRPITDYAGV